QRRSAVRAPRLCARRAGRGGRWSAAVPPARPFLPSALHILPGGPHPRGLLAAAHRANVACPRPLQGAGRATRRPAASRRRRVGTTPTLRQIVSDPTADAERRAIIAGLPAVEARMPFAGERDVAEAVRSLQARLPAALAVLAELAFDLHWSWLPDGDAVFRAVDPHRWELCGANPVRLLQESGARAIERAAADAALLARAAALCAVLRADRARPFADPGGAASPERP